MNSGGLREYITIKQPGEPIDDGYGGQLDGTPIDHPSWARVQNLKGSETVIASRMTGVQPVVITVRWTPALAAMTTAWAVSHGDRHYNVRSVAADERREFIEILADFNT